MSGYGDFSKVYDILNADADYESGGNIFFRFSHGTGRLRKPASTLPAEPEL